MRQLLILTAFAVAAPAAANAQMYPQHAYSNSYTSPGYAVNSSEQHVLRLPQGYQEAPAAYAPAPTSDYPVQRPAFQPANRAGMAPMDPTVKPVMTTAASPRMLPQPDVMLTPDATTTVVTTTTTTSATPMATPVAYKIGQPMPASSSISDDDGDTVQLRKSCDNELNHRSRNKGVNTSTTVFNDCLN